MIKNTGLLICDLSGYSAMTEAHGPKTAANLVNRYLLIVKDSMEGETILKERVGDEVVLLSNQIDDLVRTAINMHRLAEKESNFLSIHTGIHYGEIYEEKGHLFGTSINLASRITAYATGGQILCSESSKNKLKSMKDYRIEYLGIKKFKNISKPIKLFDIIYKELINQRVTDPVCQMQMLRHQAGVRINYQQLTYYFCSMNCVRKFSEDPEQYIIFE